MQRSITKTPPRSRAGTTSSGRKRPFRPNFKYEVIHVVDQSLNKRSKLEDSLPGNRNSSEALVEDVAVFDCSLCNRPLSNGELRFKCADPSCKNFYMCAKCFTSGKETDRHVNNHPYYVFHNLGALKLEKSEWSIDEEILLLEGIQLYGFGNWTGVSSHLSSRDPKECESHYMEKYVHGISGVLPEVKTPWMKRKERALAIKLEKAQKEISSMPGAGVVGYMPLRDDFDVEYMNEAEKMIAGVKFDKREVLFESIKTSEPEQKERISYNRNLKLELVKTYNRTIDERNYRKDFIKRYGLMDLEIRKKEKKRTKQEKCVRSQLRPLAQFLSFKDFEELVEGTLREHAIKERLNGLKKYREMGFTSLAEVENYKSMQRKGFDSGRYKSPIAAAKESSKGGSRSRRARRSTSRVSYAEENNDSDYNSSDDTSSFKNSDVDWSKYLRPKAIAVSGLNSDRVLPPGSENKRPSDMQNVLSLCNALNIHPCQMSQAKKAVIDEALARNVLACNERGEFTTYSSKKEAFIVDMNKTGNVLDLNVRLASW